MLMGKVTRPTLKSDVESAVKQIEGVETVSNQIEVLPLSPDGDRLRIALYQFTAALCFAGHQADPPTRTS